MKPCYNPKVIKAFHQVGGDDRSPEERKAFLDHILELGKIVPAIDRVKRSEMREECFGDAQGSQDIASFNASPEGREALTIMAKEKLALLPADGTTHTMFNCLDMIAGDFELIFLSIGDWYNYPSGFVFNAEELIKAGAAYRSRDILGDYRREVEEVVSLTYDSTQDARREINEAIERVRNEYESTGQEGITLLRADCSSKDGCPGEIVWPGYLPLGLAIEMWREGRRTTFKEGVRR